MIQWRSLGFKSWLLFTLTSLTLSTRAVSNNRVNDYYNTCVPRLVAQFSTSSPGFIPGVDRLFGAFESNSRAEISLSPLGAWPWRQRRQKVWHATETLINTPARDIEMPLYFLYAYILKFGTHEQRDKVKFIYQKAAKPTPTINSEFVPPEYNGSWEKWHQDVRYILEAREQLVAMAKDVAKANQTLSGVIARLDHMGIRSPSDDPPSRFREFFRLDQGDNPVEFSLVQSFPNNAPYESVQDDEVPILTLSMQRRATPLKATGSSGTVATGTITYTGNVELQSLTNQQARNYPVSVVVSWEHFNWAEIKMVTIGNQTFTHSYQGSPANGIYRFLVQ